VFPELSLTGYEMWLAEALAFSEQDRRLAPLLDEAARHSMILVVGAPVRIGACLHIGAFILFPDRTMDVYTKHHLGAFSDSARHDGTIPPAEATVFAPGDRDPLVRLGSEVAAIAVCADVGRPSHAAHAASRGARFYLASMFVIPSDLAGDMEKLESRARGHRMLVAFANFGGPSGGLASGGRSSIWSPTGDLLVRLESSGAGLAIAMETPDGWGARSVGE
jgi:predicted amidohydrolase